MSSNLLTFINRMFTAVLLVIMLFACQNMPENERVDTLKFEYQAN